MLLDPMQLSAESGDLKRPPRVAARGLSQRVARVGRYDPLGGFLPLVAT
jgi:hypothetical protein